MKRFGTDPSNETVPRDQGQLGVFRPMQHLHVWA